MDRKAVEATFTKFVQDHHTNLNSRQLRFVALLKNHLSKFGTISIAQLYDQPFTALHHDGLDGLFPEAEQAESIVTLVKGFGVDLGARKFSASMRVSE